MKYKLFGIMISILIGLLWSCQKEDSLQPLTNELVTRIKQDSPHIAHLEAAFGLAFTNVGPNWITSDDFYIRTDHAKVFYGYALQEAEIKITEEDDQKILIVKLPQPKQVSIDRGVTSLELTHKDYRPVDEDGKLIDVDAWMVQKLEEAIQKYEDRTLEMTKTISREYFETLAHRFGMILRLEFADQSSSESQKSQDIE